MPGGAVREGDEGEERERELGVDGVADREGRGLEVAVAAEVELVEEHAQAAEQALQDHQTHERVGRAADDGPRLAQAVRDGDDHAEQA